MRLARQAISFLFSALFCFGAWAQAYPTQPIKLVLPFAAGTGSEAALRMIAERLGAVLKQPIVFENRPGAGSTLGADLVAKAAPDGYTLLMGSITTNAVNPVLYKKLPYDHIRDFAPISMVGTAPNALDCG